MDHGVSGLTPSAPAVLWQPTPERRRRANLTRYMHWLRDTRGLNFSRYDQLWTWSVTDLEAFWASIWDFFQVRAHRPYQRVLSERTMPGARWFDGAELNYVDHVFRPHRPGPAIIAHAEGR